MPTCTVLPVCSWTFWAQTAKWRNHSQRTSERPLSAPSTQTTKLSLANSSSPEKNANSVTDAPSITAMQIRESWSTHFQTFQKAWLSLQCQRRWRAITVKRETTAITSTTTEAMFLHPSSIQTTTRIRWSRSPLLLIWLLFLVVSVVSTQTNTWLLSQWVSTQTWTDSVTCHHTWCTNSKCRCRCTSSQWLTANQCHSETRHLETPPLKTSLSILRQDLQAKMVKDMRRKIKTHHPKSLARRERRLSQRSTWPSKRRTRTKILQLRPPLTKSLSRTSLLPEPRRCQNDTHQFCQMIEYWPILLLKAIFKILVKI